MQHLIIKPLDVGLETSLFVTTNRRSYHLRLRSHRTQYMPQVSFTYPEDAMAKWENMRSREVKERQEKTIPGTGEYLGDLNFDYEVSGSAPWKPVRVFNDGNKTIIQMPHGDGANRSAHAPGGAQRRRLVQRRRNGDGELPRAERPLHRRCGF